MPAPDAFPPQSTLADEVGRAGARSVTRYRKGLADEGKNADKMVNDWWYGDTGTKAGPTREKVNGIAGCNNKAAAPYNCVVLLPVATNDPAPQRNGNDRLFFILAVMAFDINQTASNQHTGKLLDNDVVSGPGDNTWCRDFGRAVVLHLSS